MAYCTEAPAVPSTAVTNTDTTAPADSATSTTTDSTNTNTSNNNNAPITTSANANNTVTTGAPTAEPQKRKTVLQTMIGESSTARRQSQPTALLTPSIR